MVRILYLFDSLNQGGCELRTLRIMKDLSNNFDINIACFNSGQLDNEASKIAKLHILNAKELTFGLGKFISILSFLAKNRFDIIHTIHDSPNIWGVLAAKLCGVPKVVSSRIGLNYRLENSKFFAAFQIFCSLFVDKFICVSEYVRGKVIMQEKVTTDKVEVVYNGIEMNKGNNKYAYIKGNSKAIGIVARIHPVKNHILFIRAAKKVLELYGNVKFLIAGEGDLSKLKSLTEDLGISKSIIFVSGISDIHNFDNILDIGVSCSFSEGMSNAILEYMYAGKPVIATDVGGNSELIDKTTGILVPSNNIDALAEAMIDLLKNSKKAKTMGINGKKKVLRHFAFSAMVKGYEKLYRQLQL